MSAAVSGEAIEVTITDIGDTIIWCASISLTLIEGPFRIGAEVVNELIIRAILGDSKLNNIFTTARKSERE